jgi:hypothetical protein
MAVFAWFLALCYWADLLFPPCLAVYALIRWRGRWRILAAAPLLVVVPAAIAFLRFRHERSPNSALLLLYVAATLGLCAYSAVVLLLYCRQKPQRA